MGDKEKKAIAYREFLDEPNKEKEFRDVVLKPGVVKAIHLYEGAGGTDVDLSNYYTKAQIDAIIAALGVLDTCISTPIRHDFLMYDEVNLCWKNQFLEMDFEDTIDYTCTNLWMALNALIRFEDSYTGDGITIEDAL